MTPANENAPAPEKQLLACCARTKLTPEGAATIHKILAGPLDWEYLLFEAEENSISPLLDRHLSAVAPGAAPPAAQEQLKKTCRANTVRCLYLTAELINILRLFQAQNIPSIPYKGPVLAAQAFTETSRSANLKIWTSSCVRATFRKRTKLSSRSATSRNSIGFYRPEPPHRWFPASTITATSRAARWWNCTPKSPCAIFPPNQTSMPSSAILRPSS